MKEICIPFTDIADEKQAEVEVRIPDTGEVWRYRLEALPLNNNEMNQLKNQAKIGTLQKYIGSYSHDWELIQIFGANEQTGNIHLLYREKAGQFVNR